MPSPPQSQFCRHPLLPPAVGCFYDGDTELESYVPTLCHGQSVDRSGLVLLTD
ncbi:Uncharacterised protein [Vibrio cholerae]|nr:Uncharacterised protein [Vibrio cholerae]